MKICPSQVTVTLLVDPNIRNKVGNPAFPGDIGIWIAFATIVHVTSGLLATLSQIALVSKIIGRHANVPTFLLLCILQPFTATMTENHLWDKCTLFILMVSF